MHCCQQSVGVFHFQNHCIAKLTDFLPNMMTCSSILGITLDVFSSPKSVGGNLLYSGDEQNVFFSDQVGAKKFTEFSAKL